MYYVPTFTVYQFNHSFTLFFPTKHLTLIGNCLLSYWTVLLATTTSLRKLYLPTFQGSPEFVGIISIKIHVIQGMAKKYEFVGMR